MHYKPTKIKCQAMSKHALRPRFEGNQKIVVRIPSQLFFSCFIVRISETTFSEPLE